MTIYKANPEQFSKFLSLPESGMGYQLFKAQMFFSESINYYVAFNSQLIIPLDSNFEKNKNDFSRLNYTILLNEAKILRFIPFSISILSTNEIAYFNTNLFGTTRVISESQIKEKHRYINRQGAKITPEKHANGIDLFVRLSAFENDHRIDLNNNRLLEGSFTTTIKDYEDCLGFKDDPVDRYALPYDEGEQVKWAFYLKPMEVDIYQEGVVQPAFGHFGGGIEDYWKKGTSKDTYFEKREYGK